MITINTIKEYIEYKVAGIIDITLILSHWDKYGLEVYGACSEEELQASLIRHTMVANYLDSNEEMRKKYKKDQTGELRYYDILIRAEQRGVT